MSLEKLDYREVLNYLTERFGGKMLLSVSDVSREFKLDRRTVAKRYPFQDNKIELTRLASLLCVSSADVRRVYHR